MNNEEAEKHIIHWLTTGDDLYYEANVYPHLTEIARICVSVRACYYAGETRDCLINECVCYLTQHLQRQYELHGKIWNNLRTGLKFLCNSYITNKVKHNKQSKRDITKLAYLEDFTTIFLNEDDETDRIPKELLESLSYNVRIEYIDKESYEFLKKFWAEYSYKDERFRKVVDEIFKVIEENKLEDRKNENVRGTVTKRFNGSSHTCSSLFDKWLETSKKLFAFEGRG